jgi:hypothetical protein
MISAIFSAVMMVLGLILDIITPSGSSSRS